MKKNFTIKDYTEEFPLGVMRQNLIGGRSYLKINWSIPGTTNKGSIEPVGVVALDKLPQPQKVVVSRAAEGADIAAVISSIKDADYQTVAPAGFGLAWNKAALYLVIVKPATSPAGGGSVRFVIDGKKREERLSFLCRPGDLLPFR